MMIIRYYIFELCNNGNLEIVSHKSYISEEEAIQYIISNPFKFVSEYTIIKTYEVVTNA